MSQPTIDQVAPNGVVDVSKGPAGALDDAAFDAMFPADGTTQVIAPVQQTQPPSGTPAAPAPVAQPSATPQGSEPFLKGQKSIYNSAEAAIEGINQKDALIEQLRQRYALTTGIDPITGQPIQATQPQPTQNDDYYQNPDRYLDDLYNAAKQGGPQAYRDVQAKFMLDTLKPLQPILQRAAREQAVEETSKAVPTIGTFIGSQLYDKTLSENPELRHAITTAEQDYRWHSRLPGLYKLAYQAGQGLNLPEILKANQPITVQNPPAAPRPTAQPTTQSMPTTTAAPNLRNLEGIRATIAQLEANGAKLTF
jgi:hypothetical protein